MLVGGSQGVSRKEPEGVGCCGCYRIEIRARDGWEARWRGGMACDWLVRLPMVVTTSHGRCWQDKSDLTLTLNQKQEQIN